MTLVCAPVKRWPNDLPVDLYEFEEGRVKKIYRRDKSLAWVLINYEDEVNYYQDPFIVSYHDYRATGDLESILRAMKEKWPNATYYKIATFANSSLDALRMLHFQKKHPEVIGLCMGEKGVITRILSPIVKAPLMYAPLKEEDQNAPGQLLWKTLVEIYHFPKLTRETKIYALIGNPVSQSLGHLFHNDQFQLKRENKIYVKIPLEASELSCFFQLIEGLNIEGMSVTSPLKEKVIPYLQELSPLASYIQSVNTITKINIGWKGDNTDGEAALKGLENLEGKTVIVLGAGGAARSIVYALVQQKAHVVIWNRTLKRAQNLAQEFGCKWSARVFDYDILINTTAYFEDPLPCTFKRDSTVMDISVKSSSFLERAKHQGCHTLNGFSMFFAQAIKQQDLFNT
ncbi:type I 3-dehydroquinate dehydratase [Rhabdochlamydiaceae symbiont of Dictyostelium giganteum]|uniref:type I 3-dehydroquinate dehydratase n=1 Tax=Rhabdochlamydiaceae symbiont of Dictyostelium giganteum TaxID=3342349 RepID=UPI00384B3DCE